MGTRVIVVLFAVATGIWLTASDRRSLERAAEPAPPRPHPRVIEGPFDGLAIQVYSADDALSRYGKLIRETADMGAKCVMLSVNGYQERVESTAISVDPQECPPDDVWLKLFDVAHGRGLKVVLMPKILLIHPGGKWRGKIQPPSWDVWFTQYRGFVMRFAKLAEAGGVELLIIGSELVSTEKQTEHWRALIRDTRQVFSGLLAYSANWDHYAGIRFWRDVDVIGLTTYHQLSETPEPSRETLRNAWRPIRERILTWRGTVDRPIVFTEVGWCSQEGCSVEPWNYYHKEQATPAGHEEQRRNYVAFIETWEDDDPVQGMIWWEWNDAPGGPDDYGYTPRGKPAEDVLRALFKRR